MKRALSSQTSAHYCALLHGELLDKLAILEHSLRDGTVTTKPETKVSKPRATLPASTFSGFFDVRTKCEES